MQGWAKWLWDLGVPLVKRVLAALGFGTVTYLGASAALNTMLSAAKAALTGLTGSLLQLLALGGFLDFMSIIAGALIASLVWYSMKRFTLQSGGSE